MREKREEKPVQTGNGDGMVKKPTTVVLLREKSKREASGTVGQPPALARKKRITLADIARHAGVSSSTVSIVLADRRDISISEVTRDRIKRSAEELGYFPSRLGKGFLHGSSKLVGILIMSDSHLPFLECMLGIQEGLAAADYVPIVLSLNWLSGYAKSDMAASQNRVDEFPDIRRLLEYQVDGVVFFSTDAAHTNACLGELVNRRIPTIVLGGMDFQAAAVDVVGGDNEAIGRMAAEHLLSAGCASFAFGRPPLLLPLEDAVRSSFAARIKAAGRACEDFIVDMDNPGDLEHSLSRLVRPSAGIFATREEIAALALRAALSLGWRVPRDCAVMGMGQTTLSRLNALPITTIDRNSFMAGEEAAKLLVQRIEGLAEEPRCVLIPPSLTARSSSISDVSWQLLPADSAVLR